MEEEENWLSVPSKAWLLIINTASKLVRWIELPPARSLAVNRRTDSIGLEFMIQGGFSLQRTFCLTDLFLNDKALCKGATIARLLRATGAICDGICIFLKGNT
jgi:hypothetical protein